MLLMVALIANASAFIIWFTPLNRLHPYLLMGGWPLVKLLEFGFGIWLAILLGKKSESAVPTHRVVLVLAGLGIFVVGVLGLQVWWLYPQHAFFIVLGLLCVCWVPLAFISRSGPLGGLLRTLGSYSYGLFLFHWPLVHWLVDATRRFNLFGHPWALATALLIIIWPPLIFIEKRTRLFFARF